MTTDGNGRDPDQVTPPLPKRTRRARKTPAPHLDEPPREQLPAEVERTLVAAKAGAAVLTGEYISRQRPAWWGDLECGKEAPHDCIFNAAIIARQDAAFSSSLRFNSFLNIIECRHLPWDDCDKWRAWSDWDEGCFCHWCQSKSVMIKTVAASIGVLIVARENTVNSMLEYLESLQWDGVERLSTWLVDYCNAKDTRYVRAISRCWPIGLAMRAYEPGAKVDHVLIAEGPQGCGKSTMAEIWALKREWFTADLGKIGTKDAMLGLMGKLVVEIAELAALRRADNEGVKAFLTKTFDTYRPPYGRKPVDHLRCNGWFGSNNTTEWATDETGNRRYWSVAVDRIDTDGLRRDIGQLWAEAIVAYKSGEINYLAGDVIEEAKQEQSDRMIVDAWQEKIEVFMANHNLQSVSIDKINSECLNIPVKEWNEATKKRIGRCLVALGYRRKKVWEFGKTKWRYVAEPSPSGLHGEGHGEGENSNVVSMLPRPYPPSPSFLEKDVMEVDNSLNHNAFPYSLFENGGVSGEDGEDGGGNRPFNEFGTLFEKGD